MIFTLLTFTLASAQTDITDYATCESCGFASKNMCQGDSDDIAADWFPKAVVCCEDDDVGNAACGDRCDKLDLGTFSGA